MSSESIVTIKPAPSIALPNLREVWDFRELFLTFVMRDLKVRYRQTVIGGIWAIIQPLTTMIIFSFFFGYLAKIPGDGVPYPIFSYSGLVLWIYFANTLSATSANIVGSANLFTKVYFPRIIAPLAAGITGMVDYAIALIILAGLMIYYHIGVTPMVILLPVLLFMTWLLAAGIGLWIGSINVKYRDVGYILPFFTQIFMYVTPVIYPVSIAPNFKNLLALNPMTGIIETHRAIILNNTPINWVAVAYAMVVTILIFIFGAIYFRSMERRFADIV
jgi:lipopolysaccharide transport system permease protein